MPASSLRIGPFLAASVVLHAAAFIAMGPQRLAISPAAAGIGQVVSVRLQAAPADSEPMREPPVEHARPNRPGATTPPPPVETPEPESARAISPVEIAETDMIRTLTTVEAAESETTHELTPTETAKAETTQALATVEPATPDTTRAIARVQMAEPDAPRATVPVETKELDAPARRQRRQAASADQAGANGTASHTSMSSAAPAYSVVVTQLAKHFHYPRLARQRGWEGTVVLSVRVLSDGRLADIRVKDSSGRALLDRAAVRSLRQVRRLPRLAGRPETAGGLQLKIPVTYRLETV